MHKQWSEKVRSRRFYPRMLDKIRNYEGPDQIKENRSLSPWGGMIPILKRLTVVTICNNWSPIKCTRFSSHYTDDDISFNR